MCSQFTSGLSVRDTHFSITRFTTGSLSSSHAVSLSRIFLSMTRFSATVETSNFFWAFRMMCLRSSSVMNSLITFGSMYVGIRYITNSMRARITAIILQLEEINIGGEYTIVSLPDYCENLVCVLNQFFSYIQYFTYTLRFQCVLSEKITTRVHDHSENVINISVSLPLFVTSLELLFERGIIQLVEHIGHTQVPIVSIIYITVPVCNFSFEN